MTNRKRVVSLLRAMDGRVTIHTNANFVPIQREIAMDARLSFAARGLYMAMVSCGSISITQLISMGIEKRVKVLAAIAELVKYGYLTEHKTDISEDMNEPRGTMIVVQYTASQNFQHHD